MEIFLSPNRWSQLVLFWARCSASRTYLTLAVSFAGIYSYIRVLRAPPLAPSPYGCPFVPSKTSFQVPMYVTYLCALFETSDPSDRLDTLSPCLHADDWPLTLECVSHVGRTLAWTTLTPEPGPEHNHNVQGQKKMRKAGTGRPPSGS